MCRNSVVTFPILHDRLLGDRSRFSEPGNQQKQATDKG
jgi:hypothetical protein